MIQKLPEISTNNNLNDHSEKKNQIFYDQKKAKSILKSTGIVITGIQLFVISRVENNHYFFDTMVGYGYRPFKKSYGWLWLGYITILTIITKITVLTIITIITIITINGYHG